MCLSKEMILTLGRIYARHGCFVSHCTTEAEVDAAAAFAAKPSVTAPSGFADSGCYSRLESRIGRDE